MSYENAALDGYGYDTAAIDGYGYDTAAIDGYGYDTAAIDGHGYDTAALEGCGKRKVSLRGPVAKGSAEAKARMAYLRSLRGKKGATRGGKRIMLDWKSYLGGPGTRQILTKEDFKQRIKELEERRRKEKEEERRRYASLSPEEQSKHWDEEMRKRREENEKIFQARFNQFPPRYPLLKKGAGFNPLGLIGKSLKFWGSYGKSWYDDSKRDKDQLAMLEKLKKQRGGKFELKDIRDGLLGPIGWIRMGIRKSRQRKIDALKKELGVN